MTHREMVNEFLRLNLRTNDTIEITLTNGETSTWRLSDHRVHGETALSGEIIKSRIGVLPPSGMIVAPIPQPVLCENIVEIKKVN
jgi:hypothetical protein